jgi:hypothetical protein
MTFYVLLALILYLSKQKLQNYLVEDTFDLAAELPS